VLNFGGGGVWERKKGDGRRRYLCSIRFKRGAILGIEIYQKVWILKGKEGGHCDIKKKRGEREETILIESEC